MIKIPKACGARLSVWFRALKFWTMGMWLPMWVTCCWTGEKTPGVWPFFLLSPPFSTPFAWACRNPSPSTVTFFFFFFWYSSEEFRDNLGSESKRLSLWKFRNPYSWFPVAFAYVAFLASTCFALMHLSKLSPEMPGKSFLAYASYWKCKLSFSLIP